MKILSACWLAMIASATPSVRYDGNSEECCVPGPYTIRRLPTAPRRSGLIDGVTCCPGTTVALLRRLIYRVLHARP